MQTWWTDYPTILEPPQNSRRQKSNMQQCPYCGRTRVRRRRTSICHSDLAPVICASLFQPTSLSCLCGFNRSARADLYWLIPASILGVRTDGTALLIARLMVIFKTYIKISFTYYCLAGITVLVHFVNIVRKGKGEVHPWTGHEGPEREQRYSSTVSVTSALDGGWSAPRLGRFTPGKDAVPIV